MILFFFQSFGNACDDESTRRKFSPGKPYEYWGRFRSHWREYCSKPAWFGHFWNISPILKLPIVFKMFYYISIDHLFPKEDVLKKAIGFFFNLFFDVEHHEERIQLAPAPFTLRNGCKRSWPTLTCNNPKKKPEERNASWKKWGDI